MIVGTGTIAKNLSSSKLLIESEYIIIAAGVSNSSERSRKEFIREETFICDILSKASKKIIYLSTFFLNNNSTAKTEYAKNKQLVEDMILEHSHDNIILRLPNIIASNGSLNQNTMIPFFLNKIQSGEVIHIQEDTWRYIATTDDLLFSLEAFVNAPNLIDNNRIFDFYPREKFSVLELAIELGNLIGKKTKYRLIESGISHQISNPKWEFNSSSYNQLSILSNNLISRYSK